MEQNYSHYYIYIYVYIPCDYFITPYLNKLPNSLEGIILILNIRVTFYGSSHSCCRSHVFFSITFLYHSNYIPIDYVPTIFPFDSRNLPKNYSGIVATIPYFLSNVLRYRDRRFTYIHGKLFGANVGEYSIHGMYGQSLFALTRHDFYDLYSFILFYTWSIWIE